MVTRHDQHQRIGAENEGLQTVKVHQVGHHADVAYMIAHRINNLLTGTLFEANRNTGMVREKTAQHLPQVLAQGLDIAQQCGRSL